MFFLFLLWRAHWSTLPEFKSFSIGPREPDLRRLLMAEDSGGVNVFGVLLSRFDTDPDRLDRLIAMPSFLKWESPHSIAVRFQILSWVALVTTSRVGMPVALQSIALASGHPVRVFMPGRLIRDTPTYQEYARLIQQRDRLLGRAPEERK